MMAIADEQPATRHTAEHAGFWGLTLGAIGVVYGDIGTSPLYAFREAFRASGETGAGTGSGRAWRSFPDFLGTDADRHNQIHHHHAARRQ